MKKIVITALAAATLSIFAVSAQAEVTGGGSSSSLDFGIGGALGANYDAGAYTGNTMSNLSGSSGAQSSLDGWGVSGANSQSFTAGGALVGTNSSANFNNPAKPTQNSISYELGANYQTNTLNTSGNATGTAISGSFQNFKTNGDTTLTTSTQAFDVGFVVGGFADSSSGTWAFQPLSGNDNSQGDQGGPGNSGNHGGNNH